MTIARPELITDRKPCASSSMASLMNWAPRRYPTWTSSFRNASSVAWDPGIEMKRKVGQTGPP